MKTRNTYVSESQMSIWIPFDFNDHQLHNISDQIQKNIEDKFTVLKSNNRDPFNYLLSSLTLRVDYFEDDNMIRIKGPIRCIHYIVNCSYILIELIRGFDSKKLLSTSEYNSKINIYKSSDNKIYCPLSMEYIRKGVLVAELHCGHTFKNHLLKKYLTQFSKNPMCPICRCNI